MKRFNLSSLDTGTKLALTLMVASVALVAFGLFAVVSAVTDDDVKLPHEGSINDIVGESSVNESFPIVNPDGTTASPAPTGPVPNRLQIAHIGVDAPVVALGFEEGTSTPAVPNAGHEVAWYNFSPSPGLGNNAVFSGHVDWQTPTGQPIPGAFYRLRELQIGDPITITLEDGSQLEYRVTGNVATKYDDPNVVRSMQSTTKDVITLITCGGQWVNDPSHENGGNYTHRIILRAERDASAAAAAIDG